MPLGQVASARRQSKSIREKDLKRHMTNTDKQAESLAGGAEASSDKTDGSEIESESGPLKFKPREDYQVGQALAYLKSFEVFERMGKKKVQ